MLQRCVAVGGFAEPVGDSVSEDFTVGLVGDVPDDAGGRLGHVRERHVGGCTRSWRRTRRVTHNHDTRKHSDFLGYSLSSKVRTRTGGVDSSPSPSRVNARTWTLYWTYLRSSVRVVVKVELLAITLYWTDDPLPPTPTTPTAIVVGVP